MPLGAITFKDEGILPGMSILQKSLDSYFDQRDKLREEYRKQGILKKTLDEADFSTPAGTTQFVLDFVKNGGKATDAVAIAKQATPSEFDIAMKNIEMARQRQSSQQPIESNYQPTISAPVQSVSNQDFIFQPDENKEEQTLPEQKPPTQQEVSAPPPITPFSPPRQIMPSQDPALQGTAFPELSNTDLAVYSTSSDPRLSKLAEFEQKSRENAYDRFDRERKYATEQSKDYMKKIRESDISMPKREAGLGEIEYGIKNRDSGKAMRDRWLTMLPLGIGETWISPEGNLLRSGVKTFVIGDLGNVTGQKNQYLERISVTANPSIEKSPLSNAVLYYGKRAELDMEKKRNELTFQTANEYPFVPANIQEIVNEKIKPYAIDTSDKLSYFWREAQEQENGLLSLKGGKLKEYISEPVVKGTVLTTQMKDKFVEVYGNNDGYKLAVHLGYKIPSKQDVERWKNEW